MIEKCWIPETYNCFFEHNTQFYSNLCMQNIRFSKNTEMDLQVIFLHLKNKLNHRKKNDFSAPRFKQLNHWLLKFLFVDATLCFMFVFLSSDPIKNTIYFKFKSSKHHIVTQLTTMHCLLFWMFLFPPNAFPVQLIR